MRFSSVVKSLLLLLIFLGACSQREEFSSYEVAQTSWESWMAKYIEQNPQVEAVGEDGLYMETLQEPELISKSSPQAGDWVRVNYTSKTMSGEIFATRYADVATQQGTYSQHTHYVPEYLELYSDKTYADVPYGVYDALLTMKETQIARAYVPYYLGYGDDETYYYYGYDGQYSLAANQNFTMDIELVEVIKDIEEYQYNKVVEAAYEKWGLTSKDTIAKGLYAIYDLYPYEGTEPRDSIALDSMVYIYYKASFLDGFVFDTNIDTVGTPLWDDYFDGDGSAISYTPANETLIDAFYQVVPTMVYDQWVGMVFTSDYGYGEDGSTPSSYSSGSETTSSVIQPYEPLIFEFWVEAYEADDDDD